MGEIRIVGPGETRGYPYPVCKKWVVDCTWLSDANSEIIRKNVASELCLFCMLMFYLWVGIYPLFTVGIIRCYMLDESICYCRFVGPFCRFYSACDGKSCQQTM